MSNSILQIRQTPGIMHMDADPGQFSIRQPKATLQISTTPGRLEVESYQPELEVDSTRAFAAYNGGNFLEMNQRIYSGIQQKFLQAIATRVQEGNQAAAIHRPGNTIAQIYGTDWKPVPFPEVRGPASMDNVEVRISTRAPDIRFKPAEVDVQIQRNQPEIEYMRGKLDMYMQQYASIQFIPPELDMTW